MQARLVSFGLLEIEGQRYDHDVIIEAGVVRKRSKKPSKLYRGRFGHTPLSLQEDIPWSTRRIVVGSGAFGRLPIMDDVVLEARRRGVELEVLPTSEACRLLGQVPEAEVCAILHVTC